MSLLNRALHRLADRVHPGEDDLARQAGFVVAYTNGRRVVSHPDLARYAAARRAAVLADPAHPDRMWLDAATERLALAEAAARAARLREQLASAGTPGP